VLHEPPPDLLGPDAPQRVAIERCIRRDRTPQPLHDVRAHVQDVGGFPRRRPRLAPLEQERVALGVRIEQQHGAVAVVGTQRVGFMLGLLMRPLHLQHAGGAVGAAHRHDEGARSGAERTVDREAPPRDDGVDPCGQRVEPPRAAGPSVPGDRADQLIGDRLPQDVRHVSCRYTSAPDPPRAPL
jgi:hypothetical protein